MAADSEVCSSLEAPADCDFCQPLRRDNNVIVLARIDELRQMSSINLGLAILSTMYLAICIVLFVLNGYDNDCYPCAAAATSEPESTGSGEAESEDDELYD